MTGIDNQAYLRNNQYKTAANLEARIALHRDYSANPYLWQRWVFDRLALEAGMAVLEVGCGTADLWAQNLDRLPPGVRAVLGDYSIGMAQTARQKLAGQTGPAGFGFLTLDAQFIPFPDDTFDRAAANHMLYHVPDIERAVAELHRVLRPGGRLIAATNGNAHMGEIIDLARRFMPPGYNQAWLQSSQLRRYALENALELIGASFEMVELHQYEDSLEVTQAGPILAYIGSMSTFDPANGGPGVELDAVRAYLEDHFAHHATFHVTKSGGVAVGIKA